MTKRAEELLADRVVETFLLKREPNDGKQLPRRRINEAPDQDFLADHRAAIEGDSEGDDPADTKP